MRCVWLRRWIGMMEVKSKPRPDLIRHDLGSRTNHPIGPGLFHPVLLIPLHPDVVILSTSSHHPVIIRHHCRTIIHNHCDNMTTRISHPLGPHQSPTFQITAHRTYLPPTFQTRSRLLRMAAHDIIDDVYVLFLRLSGIGTHTAVTRAVPTKGISC